MILLIKNKKMGEKGRTWVCLFDTIIHPAFVCLTPELGFVRSFKPRPGHFLFSITPTIVEQLLEFEADLKKLIVDSPPFIQIAFCQLAPLTSLHPVRKAGWITKLLYVFPSSLDNVMPAHS